MKTITRKVPGGKLLRLKCVVKDDKIVAPQLSGDFFLSPPEKIVALEEALEGFPVDNTDELGELLSYVIMREGIRVTGFAVEDLVLMVKEAGCTD